MILLFRYSSTILWTLTFRIIFRLRTFQDFALGELYGDFHLWDLAGHGEGGTAAGRPCWTHRRQLHRGGRGKSRGRRSGPRGWEDGPMGLRSVRFEHPKRGDDVGPSWVSIREMEGQAFFY